MAKEARVSSMMGVVNYTNRNVDYPRDRAGKPIATADLFASNVFCLQKMQKYLPKPLFARFLNQIRGKQPLDKITADAIAHAVRTWSQSLGATHFTHWFQPQTGSTGEKHDSFLTMGSITIDGFTNAVDAFSGSQLLQSEPDASSFPSGGMRTTFEARGYTIWDASSPMFIRPCGLNGAYTLYIPSVFTSYNGEALDEKTILLRSQDALSAAVTKLLGLINEPTSRVYTTLGCEQEYFLIDRSIYSMRFDLKMCGRTLIGCVPPKHQQLEDHYFGRIPSRVLATMSETEIELIKLGVPVKTRHNEVAPAQFEMAPIFEDAPRAVEHNLLAMDVLQHIAHKNKLKVLFHEKPFDGVNGSGKHCNWSMSTDEGDNLLDPTSEPENNNRFLFSLLSTVLGVFRHQGILRASIASASNDHRLGANEAPPAIISCFLGKHLDDVLNTIENGEKMIASPAQFATIKLGGRVLDLQVSVLPSIERDLTDRNRTSPLAFTGNKFEFRSVGSRQSPSFPVAMLNSAAASGFIEAIKMLEKHINAEKAAGTCPKNDKGDYIASEAAMRKTILELIKITKNARFEGDNYSESWREEAKKRGLLVIQSSPEAYDQFLESKNFEMLTETTKVFSPAELHSRVHVLQERYAKDVLIEANTMHHIVEQLILPAAFEYRKLLAETVVAMKQALGGEGSAVEAKVLMSSTPLVSNLQLSADMLKGTVNKINGIEDPQEKAKRTGKDLVPLLASMRKNVDELERIVADKYWPMPNYNEILFT